MDLDRILKPEEIIDRLKYAEKQCVRGYYYVLIRPDLRDRIIELLKKQEAVKLHTIDTDEEQYSFWFVCGNCGWKIYKVVDDENCEDRKQIHFCASCGRPISWGGR